MEKYKLFMTFIILHSIIFDIKKHNLRFGRNYGTFVKFKKINP